jgi:predicted RNA binding protein YcfA (HicA-like mRNA interferase family)
MTPKAPRVSAKDVVRALKKLGYELKSQRGSHQKWVHPESGRRVIVSMHAGDIIHTKTFATIVEGTGLDLEEFTKLMK